MANTALPIAHRVLVTGAAGFIGSHLASTLLRSGVDVIGVDNFDPFYERAAKDRNLAAIAAAGGTGRFTLSEIDICDRIAMADLFERTRPGTVIHLAAKAGVRPSIADPAGYSYTNVFGTSVVLNAAHKVGCERVVVASSSSVYGNCPTAPFHEALRRQHAHQPVRSDQACV